MAVNVNDLTIFRKLVSISEMYRAYIRKSYIYDSEVDKVKEKHGIIGICNPPGSVILIFKNLLTVYVFSVNGNKTVVVIDECTEPKSLCIVKVNEMIQPLYGDVEDIIPKLQEVLS